MLHTFLKRSRLFLVYSHFLSHWHPQPNSTKSVAHSTKFFTHATAIFYPSNIQTPPELNLSHNQRLFFRTQTDRRLLRPFRSSSRKPLVRELDAALEVLAPLAVRVSTINLVEMLAATSIIFLSTVSSLSVMLLEELDVSVVHRLRNRTRNSVAIQTAFMTVF